VETDPRINQSDSGGDPIKNLDPQFRIQEIFGYLNSAFLPERYKYSNHIKSILYYSLGGSTILGQKLRSLVVLVTTTSIIQQHLMVF